jgi:hypothetical protein
MTQKTALKKIAAACVAVRTENLSELSLPFEVMRREIETMRATLSKKRTAIYVNIATPEAKKVSAIKVYDSLLKDLNKVHKAFIQLQTTAQLHHKP